MGSADSLKDLSSDSISSHQTQRSPNVQKLQLQLAQALSAFSLNFFFSYNNYYFFYLVCNLGGGGVPATNSVHTYMCSIATTVLWP